MFSMMIWAANERHKSPSCKKAMPKGRKLPRVPVVLFSQWTGSREFSGRKAVSSAGLAFSQSAGVSSVEIVAEGAKIDPVIVGPLSGINSEKIGMELAHPPRPRVQISKLKRFRRDNLWRIIDFIPLIPLAIENQAARCVVSDMRHIGSAGALES